MKTEKREFQITDIEKPMNSVAPSSLEIRNILSFEIERGILPPRTLLDERMFSERFKVSRTKIRQAFQLLAGDDLVRIEPYAGTRVAHLSIAELRDILECCCEMEVLVAKFAARRISDDSRQAIEAAQDFCRLEMIKSDGRHQEANDRFHQAVNRAACSPYLTKQLEHSRRMLLKYIPPLMTGSPSLLRSLNEHEAIMQAIFQQDETKAMSLMAAHLPAGSTGFSEFLARIPSHLLEQL